MTAGDDVVTEGRAGFIGVEDREMECSYCTPLLILLEGDVVELLTQREREG